jgi:hypothetical protein
VSDSAVAAIASETGSNTGSVLAFDSTASETGAAGPDQGAFRFTRTGSTAAILTVTFTVSGSATSGVDYQALPVTVTFGVGQPIVDLAVIPVPDETVEGAESVVVTLTDGATYDLGSPSTATVTIAG